MGRFTAGMQGKPRRSPRLPGGAKVEMYNGK